MNHTDVEKYKTHFCFVLCPWKCIQEFVLESKACDVSSAVSECSHLDQACEGWSKSRYSQILIFCPILKLCIWFQWWVPSHLSGYFIFSYLKCEALYTLKQQSTFSKILQSPFSRWSCNHKESWQNWILVLGSGMSSFNSSASSLLQMTWCKHMIYIFKNYRSSARRHYLVLKVPLFPDIPKEEAAKKKEEHKALSRGVLPGRWQDRYNFSTILICFTDQKGKNIVFFINKIFHDWELY